MCLPGTYDHLDTLQNKLCEAAFLPTAVQPAAAAQWRFELGADARAQLGHRTCPLKFFDAP
jgi:hypothetical protein